MAYCLEDYFAYNFAHTKFKDEKTAQQLNQRKKDLVASIEENASTIVPKGLFNVKYSLVLNMQMMSFTYVIVLLQFKVTEFAGQKAGP